MWDAKTEQGVGGMRFSRLLGIVKEGRPRILGLRSQGVAGSGSQAQ